jgi:hypothetical protein
MPTTKIYSRGFIQNLLYIFLIFMQFIMKFGILNEFKFKSEIDFRKWKMLK